jgi:sigma-54 dependent transcriptional regulator, acetoin dehydrogenase operon transcriptional activator AcoR
MLERVTYLMPKNTITLDDLPIEFQQTVEHSEPVEYLSSSSVQPSSMENRRQDVPELVNEQARALKEQSINAEVQAIVQALHASNDHITQAAALLGISRTTLWRKMVKYGLNQGK